MEQQPVEETQQEPISPPSRFSTALTENSSEGREIIKSIIERDYTDLTKVRFLEACPVRIRPLVFQVFSIIIV